MSNSTSCFTASLLIFTILLLCVMCSISKEASTDKTVILVLITSS